MTRKENLVYTMKNLMKALKKHLKELDAGEIDEAVYEDLNAELFFVQEALRYYFDEDYYNRPRQITVLSPDGTVEQYYE